MFLKDDFFFVVGNGPSLETAVLDNLPDGRWIGMNAAYKYWDISGKYPEYYSCLDPVVVETHAEMICKMLNEGKISEFFLHEKIIEVCPDLKNHPRVTLRDEFIEKEGILGVSPLSRYKQTTGVLATRFCIERGHKKLCLLGIDCNYVEQLSEATVGQGYELVVEKDINRNPNYFFDSYQEKNEKYQVPNPSVHSGNLHLQSFIALKQDILDNKQDIQIYLGTKKSLLSKFSLFPEIDIDALLGIRKLECIAVPLMPREIKAFLSQVRKWGDPKLLPSFSFVRGVYLHIFMTVEYQKEIYDELAEGLDSAHWLSSHFVEVRITFLNMSPAVDYYIRGASLNRFCTKSGPNLFYLMIMRSCSKYRYTFLMEADCVPVRPGWLDALERVTNNVSPDSWIAGTNYTGPTMISEDSISHINGNAIYATGDREFQDYCSGDFVNILQWVIENVSNNVAYDTSFPLALKHYKSLIKSIAKDSRVYAKRYAYTSTVANLSGDVEIANIDPGSTINYVKNNKDVYVGHGLPFVKLVEENLDLLDSYYAQNDWVVRELRPHSFFSKEKGVQWKFKGYGILEGNLASSFDANRDVILIIKSHINNPGNGTARLQFVSDSKVSVIKSEALLISPKKQKNIETWMEEANGSYTIGAPINENKEGLYEIGFRVTIKIEDTSESLSFLNTRVMYIPLMLKKAPFKCIEVEREAELQAKQWQTWVDKNQHILSKKYSFVSANSSIWKPNLREIIPHKAARLDGELLKIDIARKVQLRFKFELKSVPKDESYVVIRLLLKASVDCDVIFFTEVESDLAERFAVHLFANISEEFSLKLPLKEEHPDFFLHMATESSYNKEASVYIEKICFIDSGDVLSAPVQKEVPRIISINPDAESFFGHFLNYESRFGKALEKLGVEHIIAGPVDAEPNVYLSYPNMERVFSIRTNKLYATKIGTKLDGVSIFVKELDEYLCSLNQNEKALLFMYCGSLEILEALHELAERHVFCTFAVSLYYLSWLDLDEGGLVSYWKGRMEKFSMHPRLRIIVPTRELVEDVKKIFGISVELLPHPSTTFSDEETEELKASKCNKPMNVVFPGNLRGGKGYDLTADTIRRLLKTKGSDYKLKVRFPPDDSVNKKRKDFFDSIKSDVDILDSYLSESEFRTLLVNADLVVLPYTADRFKNRTSGLLVDSLLLGIPCVVIKDTWLGRVVENYEFGCVSDESGESLSAAIMDAVKNINDLKRAAIRGRNDYASENSWSSLVLFLFAKKGIQINTLTPPLSVADLASKRSATVMEMAETDGINFTKNGDRKDKILIIGNGPSTKLLAPYFKDIAKNYDTFGTTTAYRFYEKIGWWPTYYGLADRKVVFHHREKFNAIIKNPEVTTKKFYLSWNVGESEKLEVIPHSSTGSFCLKKAIELGYKEIFLIGMEGAYVEEIAESRVLSGEEISTLGFDQLSLTQAEKKLRVVTKTPEYNPNYFYDDYQMVGDVYSLPQSKTHQQNWTDVCEYAESLGTKIFNLSPISQIDVFNRIEIEKIFPHVKAADKNRLTKFLAEVSEQPVISSHYRVIPTNSFAQVGSKVWVYRPSESGAEKWVAIFDVNSTVNRTFKGVMSIKADKAITANITFGRQGDSKWEGGTSQLKMIPGHLHTVELNREFQYEHDALKLQLEVIGSGDPGTVLLNVNKVKISEIRNHTIGKKDSEDDFDLVVANKLYRDGEFEEAMKIYLSLYEKCPLKMYETNALMSARKLNMGVFKSIIELKSAIRNLN